LIFECGKVLNNTYRVVRLLGKGAMGAVYLVERIKDDRQFVIKTLVFSKEAGLDESTAREIFNREAKFMEKINHPGVPQIHGVFTEGDGIFLVMDYIKGKTLEDIIKDGSITVDSAISWTIELCEILDYLHNSFEAPIVYRDMKPSNVIITPEGKAKLVDFGIARYYNPDKNTDTFSYGSPGYAAPEQYKGRGQSSPQTDVFAMGVILYQMLTGYDPTLKPFTFPDMRSLNPVVSPELENIVNRAIQLEPVKRYISIQEFKETLEKYSGRVSEKKKYHDFIPPPQPYKKPNIFAGAGKAFGLATIICLLLGFIMPGFFIGVILCPVIGLLLSIIGLGSHMLNKNISYEPLGDALKGNFVLCLIAGFLIFIILPNFIRMPTQGRLAACESNLKNIATALEMYATDYIGDYPPSLSYLTENICPSGGSYIKKIPECPGDRPTFWQRNFPMLFPPPKGGPYIYMMADCPDNFTLICGKTKSHISTGTVSSDGCWPQYTPGYGINLK